MRRDRCEKLAHGIPAVVLRLGQVAEQRGSTHDVEPPVALSLFGLMPDVEAGSVTVTTAVTPLLVWVDKLVM